MDTHTEELLDAAIGPLFRTRLEVLDFWTTLYAFIANLAAPLTEETQAITRRHVSHLESLHLQTLPKMNLVDFVLDCTAQELVALQKSIEQRLNPDLARASPAPAHSAASNEQPAA